MALLALELARDEPFARHATRRGAATRCPADGPPWVVMLATPALGRGPRRHRGPRGDAGRAASADVAASPRAARQLGEPRAAAGRRSPGRRSRWPRRRRTAWRRSSTGPLPCRRPFPEPGARPAAEAAARATLEAAELLAGSAARSSAPRVCLPTCCWATSATFPTASARRVSCSRPILVGRAETQRERLDTLARRARRRPSLAEAAARLGVHRNTIAYRVQRLEARGDWDLVGPGAARRADARGSGHAKCTRSVTGSGTEPQPGPPDTVSSRGACARIWCGMHKRDGG